MINGTKLLNVAGMTRGRRDGILKAEKQKHVVKIGPMHLKGVWIPFEKALEFANKEKITEMLYPLFVHNIGALLYHPVNHGHAGRFPHTALGGMVAAGPPQGGMNMMRPPTQEGHPGQQQQPGQEMHQQNAGQQVQQGMNGERPMSGGAEPPRGQYDFDHFPKR
jgi:protein SOK2